MSFKTNVFHPGLAAAISKKTVLDPIINIELQCEISRLTRTSLIKVESDASACYDCIIPGLASAIRQLNGMPKTVCVVHAVTLKEVRHYLKLMLNVSEESYRHSIITPVYGTGQGSSNSPYLWLFVNDIIFKLQRKYTHDAYYIDPLGQHHLFIYVLGFMDDINNFVNNLLNPECTVE